MRNEMIELKTLKEVFLELAERFESTENLQAMETLLNYFEDFDFGFSDDDVLEITSAMIGVINKVCLVWENIGKSKKQRLNNYKIKE